MKKFRNIRHMNLKRQKEHFDKHGVVVFRNLIPKRLINKCLFDLKNYKPGKVEKNNKHVVIDSYKNKKYIRYFQHLNFYIKSFNIFFNSKLIDISSYLLKDKSYFSSINYHNKIPGGSATPPHQDNFYWCRKPNKALTAYIALNKQNESNGGIKYYSGSHLGKIYKHENANVKGFSSFIKKKNLPNVKIFKTQLNPGDVIFHHCNVIHEADKNNHKSKQRQAIALAIFSFKSKINKNLLNNYLKNKPYVKIDKTII